jgi:hypothetical protein
LWLALHENAAIPPKFKRRFSDGELTVSEVAMSKALRKSAESVGYLFVLNWDMLLFFGVTAVAMGGWAYLITM